MNWGLIIVGAVLLLVPLVAAIARPERFATTDAAGVATTWIAILASLAGVAATVSGIVKEWQDEPADCIAYVSSLLEVAATVEDATKLDGQALSALYGDDINDDCGSATDFVTAIGGAGVAPANAAPDTTETP